MPNVDVCEAGGYRYLPAVFQYSGGVAAEPGWAIERVRFREPLPLDDGFAFIQQHLTSLGRPLTAFCHCELRSPAPFTDQGFYEFNRRYAGTLERWGVLRGDVNPVARSNVCPEIDPPREVCFYAFSYTVAASTGEPPSFVVAGCGEVPEGKTNYRDHIVRRGDTSPAGLVEKARFVVDEQQRRLELLGFTWADVTATHVYSVHDIRPALVEQVVPRRAAPAGLTWHFCRPPVVDVEYEMDCRGVTRERVA